MKNDMNMKTNIASIFAAATLALFTASCANEETTKQDANQETAAGTNFVGGSAVKTRTSLDVTLPGGTTVDYFWEPSDKIWTADEPLARPRSQPNRPRPTSACRRLTTRRP